MHRHVTKTAAAITAIIVTGLLTTAEPATAASRTEVFTSSLNPGTVEVAARALWQDVPDGVTYLSRVDGRYPAGAAWMGAPGRCVRQAVKHAVLDLYRGDSGFKQAFDRHVPDHHRWSARAVIGGFRLAMDSLTFSATAVIRLRAVAGSELSVCPTE